MLGGRRTAFSGTNAQHTIKTRTFQNARAMEKDLTVLEGGWQHVFEWKREWRWYQGMQEADFNYDYDHLCAGTCAEELCGLEMKTVKTVDVTNNQRPIFRH